MDRPKHKSTYLFQFSVSKESCVTAYPASVQPAAVLQHPSQRRQLPALKAQGPSWAHPLTPMSSSKSLHMYSLPAEANTINKPYHSKNSKRSRKPFVTLFWGAVCLCPCRGCAPVLLLQAHCVSTQQAFCWASTCRQQGDPFCYHSQGQAASMQHRVLSSP